jgi:hypothetical protein
MVFLNLIAAFGPPGGNAAAAFAPSYVSVVRNALQYASLNMQSKSGRRFG